MKNWPTSKQKKQSFVTATLLTFTAVMGGVVMPQNFSPGAVLGEIVMASCAVMTWVQYYNIKTKIDIKELLSNENKV